MTLRVYVRQNFLFESIYVYPESPCVRLSLLPEDIFKLCSSEALRPVFMALLLCSRFCARGSNNLDGQAAEISRRTSRRCRRQDRELRLRTYNARTADRRRRTGIIKEADFQEVITD